MKPNRKRSLKHSVIAVNTMRFGAVIVFFFLMVILNLLSSSSCTRLLNEKGQKERELARLEESHRRESSRWDEMKTAEKIEAALFRHGLKMATPRPDQYLRLNSKGELYSNQFALSKLRRTNEAKNRTPTRRQRRGMN